MAFTKSTFIPQSSMANSDAPRILSYRSGDTLAAVKGANYFDDASSTSGGLGLKNADVILVVAADGTSFLKMLVDAAGAATVGVANDFA